MCVLCNSFYTESLSIIDISFCCVTFDFFNSNAKVFVKYPSIMMCCTFFDELECAAHINKCANMQRIIIPGIIPTTYYYYYTSYKLHTTQIKITK